MVVAAYVLEVDGQDVSDKWREARRLLSVNVVDRLGVASDSVELVVDDREPHVEFPPAGATLGVWLGPDGDSLKDLGKYTLDSPVASGWPSRLRVRGHAASFVATDEQPMHTEKSRLWEGATIGAIAQTVAQEHGLGVKVATGLQSEDVGTLEQIAETDLAFLGRVAREVGGRCRVRAGTLEVFIAGALIQTPKEITPADVESWSAPIGERSKAGSVFANWLNPKEGTEGVSLAGEGEPIIVLQEVFDSDTAASSAAGAYVKDAERNSGQLSLSMGALRTDIGAGQPVELTGFRSEVDGGWTVVEAAHSADKASARSSLVCERQVD